MARKAESSKHFSIPARAIVCLLSVLIVPQARALDEIFETYNAPQALAMGNAWTADAYGYAALFHNPAGLAKATLKHWEITPAAFDGNLSTGFMGTAVEGRSVGRNRLFQTVQAHPNRYNFFKGSFVPAVARRGFGIALLGSYEYAAISDGTNIDIRSGNDYGIVIGGATNLAANMLKIGVAVKGIARNQLKGTYAHAALPPTADGISALMKEGIGIGADLGIMATLPVSYLPTLGFTWKDMLNTSFMPSTFLNAFSSGVPDPIPQSFNVALSAHPVLWKGVRASFSAEFRHIEMVQLPLRKRLHFGFQFITRRGFFIWAGANQLFPTGGVGLRVRGGDFEMATYAQDVGVGQESSADRRFLLRYTIGF